MHVLPKNLKIWFRFGAFFCCFPLLYACGAGREARKTEHNNRAAAAAFAAAYSRKMGIPIPDYANRELVVAVHSWLGVPYRFGGTDKKGVDCSGLIATLYPQVYRLSVPRTTAELYRKAEKVTEKDLKEGDLVFFKINTKEAGHAGIYLYQGYFVHASTSKGVMISSLREAYWTKYFVGGGRFSP